MRSLFALVCCAALLVSCAASVSAASVSDPASEWTQIFSQLDIEQVYMVDQLNGFMVGESMSSSSGVFRTFDGGKYYSQCVTNSSSGGAIHFKSVAALSTSTVVTITDSSNPTSLIQHALDGENFVWSTLPASFSQSGVVPTTKMQVVPDYCSSSPSGCSFAFVIQNSGNSHYMTSADGASFAISSTITNDPTITIYGFTFADNSFGLAWGEASNQTTFIFRSQGGQPWEVILANQTLLTITGVQCISEDLCYATGTTIDNDCFIRRSTDYGATWTDVYNINCMRYEGEGLWPFRLLRTPTLTDIWAAADIVNPSPQAFLVRSTDGGNTWSNATLGSTWHAVDMQFLPASTTGVNGFLLGNADNDALYVHSAPLSNEEKSIYDLVSTQ